MAKQDKNQESSAGEEVNSFVRSLSTEHKMLVVLKSQLYGGKWEPMLDDLKNRLEGKPYIFKLANRINDDIERIKELRDFEVEKNVNLSDYVELN